MPYLSYSLFVSHNPQRAQLVQCYVSRIQSFVAKQYLVYCVSPRRCQRRIQEVDIAMNYILTAHFLGRRLDGCCVGSLKRKASIMGRHSVPSSTPFNTSGPSMWRSTSTSSESMCFRPCSRGSHPNHVPVCRYLHRGLADEYL